MLLKCCALVLLCAAAVHAACDAEGCDEACKDVKFQVKPLSNWGNGQCQWLSQWECRMVHEAQVRALPPSCMLARALSMLMLQEKCPCICDKRSHGQKPNGGDGRPGNSGNSGNNNNGNNNGDNSGNSKGSDNSVSRRIDSTRRSRSSRVAAERHQQQPGLQRQQRQLLPRRRNSAH